MTHPTLSKPCSRVGSGGYDIKVFSVAMTLLGENEAGRCVSAGYIHIGVNI